MLKIDKEVRMHVHIAVSLQFSRLAGANSVLTLSELAVGTITESVRISVLK